MKHLLWIYFSLRYYCRCILFLYCLIAYSRWAGGVVRFHRREVRLSYTTEISMIPASIWYMIGLKLLQLKRVMTSQSYNVVTVLNYWCCISHSTKSMISQPIVIRFSSRWTFCNPKTKIFNWFHTHFCPKVNRLAAILKNSLFDLVNWVRISIT